jgi:hypothetical protein
MGSDISCGQINGIKGDAKVAYFHCKERYQIFVRVMSVFAD